MECYSTIKRNEILVPTTIWMNLKIIILRERSLIKSSKSCMIPFIENLLKMQN